MNYGARNQTLKDLFESFEGMQPTVFAIEKKPNCNIETFEKIQDSLIVDIDASIAIDSKVYDKDLPRFPNEIQLCLLLNKIKNQKFGNYDYLEKKQNVSSVCITHQIRIEMFKYYSDFIIPAFNSINTDAEAPEMLKDYFDRKYFLDEVKERFP